MNSQCRSRMPRLRIAVTTGMCGVNSSTSIEICRAISERPAEPSNVLASLCIVRDTLPSCASISSALIAWKEPVIHSRLEMLHLRTVVQSTAYGSKSLIALVSAE
eukprot:scaffold14471_cov113-Isochrysis_galbana.AAC.11